MMSVTSRRLRLFRLAHNRSQFSSSAVASTKPKRDFAGIAFFSSLTALTFGLGTWQLSRYDWKTNLIKELKESLTLPVVSLPPLAHADTDEVESLRSQRRRVRVRGTFDHSREILLGPRSPPKDMIEAAPGSPSSGFYVITPLRRDDDSCVLVNRGWVPKSKGGGGGKKGRGGSGAGGVGVQEGGVDRPEGVVELVGLVTEAEKPGSFPNDLSNRHLVWMDVEGAARSIGCVWREATGRDILPLYLTLIGEEESNGKDAPTPTPTPTPPVPAPASSFSWPLRKCAWHFHSYHVTPDMHLVYSATWYTLALLGTGMTFMRFRKQAAAGAAAAAAATVVVPKE